jgi:hypothetical protein
MKNRLMQSKYGKVVVLLWLSPMMMLNASQATTLCVREDGRVAIELVVDDHCTCEVHASCTGADDAPAAAALCATEEHSQACNDLSIPVGSCHGRTAPITAKAGFGGPTIAPTLPELATADVVQIRWPESPPVFRPYYTPLDSVILRV